MSARLGRHHTFTPRKVPSKLAAAACSWEKKICLLSLRLLEPKTLCSWFDRRFCPCMGQHGMNARIGRHHFFPSREIPSKLAVAACSWEADICLLSLCLL